MFVPSLCAPVMFTGDACDNGWALLAHLIREWARAMGFDDRRCSPRLRPELGSTVVSQTCRSASEDAASFYEQKRSDAQRKSPYGRPARGPVVLLTVNEDWQCRVNDAPKRPPIAESVGTQNSEMSEGDPPIGRIPNHAQSPIEHLHRSIDALCPIMRRVATRTKPAGTLR